MRESYVDFVRERVASPLFSNEKQRDFFFFFPDEKLERERERERVGKKEKGRKEKKNHFLFNQWIILREKNVWSCYNNCYSALLFERAIVAALKKNLEFREAIGGSFLCVCSPKLAAYWRCSYITEQSFFFQAFWYSA